MAARRDPVNVSPPAPTPESPSSAPGSLLRNMQRLMAGSGAAQALQFGAVLVLSRLYLPADFGVLARVQSIASVLAILATLQLHLSVPLSRSERDVEDRVSAVETMGGVWLALAIVLAVLQRPSDGLATGLALILGGANTYGSVLVFRGRFGLLSLFSVVRAVLAIALQLLCAWLHVRNGLLVGAIAGELTSALLMRRGAVGLRRWPEIDVTRALATIRASKAFTLFGTMQELISVASFYAPVFLFGSLFGQAVGGQYAMANRLVFAPVVLVSGSAAQVLYHRLGQAPPQTLADFRSLQPSGWWIPLLVLGCMAPFFLESVFLRVIGARWDLASQLIPLQVLWGAAFLLATPARVVCRMRQLQRWQLVVDLATLAAIALAFLVLPASPLGTMWRLVAIAMVQNLLLAGVVVLTLRGPGAAVTA